MSGHTIRLIGDAQRRLACDMIGKAPDRAIITIKPETRNADQNALMWVLLSDVSRAKPEGRKWVPETSEMCLHAIAGPPVPVCRRSGRQRAFSCRV